MKKSIFIFFLLFSVSKFSHALRCDDSLVSKGDTRFKVEKLCGSPVFLEQWEVVRRQVDKIPESKHHKKPHSHQKLRFRQKSRPVIIINESHDILTYNFGADSLIQYVKFINGKLVNINSGSYGFDEDTDLDYSRCVFSSSIQDSKIDIFRKCGTPSDIIVHPDSITSNKESKNGADIFVKTINNYVTWVYDKDDAKNIFHIKFLNGKVVNIKHE